MARKQTRAELQASCDHWRERACVLAWIIAEDCSRNSGFFFLRSPREHSGFLVLIEDDRSVHYWNSTAVSDEARRSRNAALWETHSRDGEDRYFLSLSEAMSEEQRFFAELRRQATVDGCALE